MFSRYKAIKVIIRGLRFGINCVKSDKFRSNRPENQSRPLFSTTADPNESGDRGDTLPMAGYPPVPEAGKVVAVGPT